MLELVGGGAADPVFDHGGECGHVALGGNAAPEFEELEERGDDPVDVLDDDLVDRGSPRAGSTP